MSRDKATLTKAEIATFVKKHTQWKVKAGQLQRTFEHPTFPNGIAFVRKVAALAQKADHHPDIDIRFTKVTLKLSTHDAGGITWRDTKLAGEYDGL